MNSKEYLNSLGLTDQQIYNIVTKSYNKDFAANYDLGQLVKKIKNVAELFEISEEESAMMFHKFPNFFVRKLVANSTVSNKIHALQNVLHANKEMVLKVICKQPMLLSYDIDSNSQTSIKSKIHAYCDFFRADYDEVVRIIFKNPNLLGMDVVSDSKTSIKTKVTEFSKILGVNKKFFGKMLLENPSLLGLSSKTLKNKFETLGNMVEKNEILLNPRLFVLPIDRLIIRYQILKTSLKDSQRVEASHMLISEQVLWARKQFMTHNGCISIEDIVKTQKKFSDTYLVNDDYLTQVYPLTKKNIEQIEKEFLKENKPIEIKKSQTELENI